MHVSPNQSTPLNPLERFLRLFTVVNSGEGLGVVLCFANIFLILTAYYILKVVREALVIGGVTVFGLEGDEVKAYLPAVMAVLLLAVVPAYGWLASRVSRLRLIATTMWAVVLLLVGFFAWGTIRGVGTGIGLSFYIFLGIVNVFLIAQFWSYANDIYDEAQGKRLFALIAVGQSLGAILGPRIASQWSEHTFVLLALSAGIFLVCLGLYGLAERAQRRTRSTSISAGGPPPLDKEGGFALVFKTPYLLLIAAMILITNVVNTTGEYILSNAAKRHAEATVPVASILGEETARAHAAGASLNPDQEGEVKSARAPVVGQFYGQFFFYVNLVALAIQMFVVSRIFKYFGVQAALFVLPVIAFAGYLAIGLLGGLAILRSAKIAENATDYSLQNTVKQVLFLPTSRAAKYKAKAAIDTFFVRFGDAVSAALVWLGLHQLAFTARDFALVNVVLCGAWIAVCAGIARHHRRLTALDSA